MSAAANSVRNDPRRTRERVAAYGRKLRSQSIRTADGQAHVVARVTDLAFLLVIGLVVGTVVGVVVAVVAIWMY